MSKFTNGTAQPACCTLGILPQGSRARLGYLGYLFGLDAIYGHPAYWFDFDFLIPANRTLVA